MNILTVNVGSSSIRLALYDSRNGQCVDSVHWPDHEVSAAQRLQEFIGKHAAVHVDAIGHRVVHGGDTFTHSVTIDAPVETRIEQLGALAPLHNPLALKWIRACRSVFGEVVRQIAVFDTAFFAALPEMARCYAIPHALTERHHLHRYGFHGLAHRGMWQQWRQLPEAAATQGRVISLQLGSGCSIAAISDGRPIDTSMGYSPLEGLVMATRPGDIDAGVVLALQQQAGLDAKQVEDLLNHASGLSGMSALSGDLRALLQSSEPLPTLAVNVYCYRIRKYVGAYLAALGGADAVLIGGGVGEHLPEIRRRMLADMQWAGLAIDATLNAAAIGVPARIDAQGSHIAVHVLPVDEGQILLDEVMQLLQARS